MKGLLPSMAAVRREPAHRSATWHPPSLFCTKYLRIRHENDTSFPRTSLRVSGSSPSWTCWLCAQLLLFIANLKNEKEFFFLPTACSMWYFRSPTRDQTHTPCIPALDVFLQLLGKRRWKQDFQVTLCTRMTQKITVNSHVVWKASVAT